MTVELDRPKEESPSAVNDAIIPGEKTHKRVHHHHQNKDVTVNSDANSDADSDADADSDSHTEVQVDFDFFPPSSIDYHATKRLLEQLFGLDGENLDLGAAADTLIGQTRVGTMVKVDGVDGDPYAVNTVLRFDEGSLAKIRSFIATKARETRPAVANTVVHMLSAPAMAARVGWLVNERLINMPPQVAPALFRMLSEEIDGDARLSGIEYLVYVTKTYREVASTADAEDDRNATAATSKDSDDKEQQPARKKQKKQANRAATAAASQVYYFNAEDEAIARFATHMFDYRLKMGKESRVADAVRAFNDCGIQPARRVLVLKRSDLGKVAERVKEFIGE